MQSFYKQIVKYLIAWLALVSLCYLFVRALPGQDFQYELPSGHFANQELLANSLKSDFWFDGLIKYLMAILKGNWGRSALFENSAILEVLAPSMLVTLKLSFVCFVLITFGVFLLLFLSWNLRFQFHLLKCFKFLFSFFAQIPILVWAPAMIYLLSVKLKIFPVALLETPLHFVLPVLALSIRPISHAYLLLQQEVEQFHSSDFVRFAMGKGLTDRQIFFGHIFRLLVPRYLSYFLPTMAGLLSGSLIVEFLFAINGMGFLFYRAFESRDLFLISGICILVGTYYLLLKLLAELLISYFEPRMAVLGEVENA